MPSLHFPMLDIQPLVFELLPSAWSWVHPQQDPNLLLKDLMRMEHSGLSTHTMLSINKLLMPLLLILNNKLLRPTTTSQVMHPLHLLIRPFPLLGGLVLWPHLLGNQLSLLDLIDMRPLTPGIIKNLINTRIDIPPRRLLMSGKQGLMHLTMLDLPDLNVLEVIPDQVYLISPPTQRWFIIIITTIIIIHQKDLRAYMVIPLPPPLPSLEIGT